MGLSIGDVLVPLHVDIFTWGLTQSIGCSSGSLPFVSMSIRVVLEGISSFYCCVLGHNTVLQLESVSQEEFSATYHLWILHSSQGSTMVWYGMVWNSSKRVGITIFLLTTLLIPSGPSFSKSGELLILWWSARPLCSLYHQGYILSCHRGLLACHWRGCHLDEFQLLTWQWCAVAAVVRCL